MTMQERAFERPGNKRFTGPVCKSNLPKELDILTENILAAQPDGIDFDLIVRAYYFAENAHKGQIRVSGDKYLIHPVEVANILADMKADDKMLAAALMHDVIEDTSVNHAQIAKEFSAEIAELVEGVTKLSRMSFSSYEERKAENARKMIFAITKDIRVILIKLADRLHNLKTLQYLPDEKQKRIAQDTLDFFAPLAHRLGIYSMKNEMEDIAFKYLMPDIYREISHKVEMRKAEREEEIHELIVELSKVLKAMDIDATVQGRAKHLYSIYKKMKRDNLNFNQILDLMALRVIVPNLKDCYSTIGVIHLVWKPMGEKIKDYIGRPKQNMYRSLHTVVFGPKHKPVEIQVRTEEMHRVAEYGVCAHWLYKEGTKEPTAFDQHLAFFRNVVDWQAGNMDAREFMDTLTIELLSEEVFVFTPKGEVVALPIKATPVDFAYHIHTEVGDTCKGARVNSQIAPLDRQLKSGDIVEIITQKRTSPSLDWLSFVVSPVAISKIKQYHRKLDYEDNVESGRLLLEKEERRGGLQALELLTEQNLKSKLSIFQYKNVNALYAAIGRGDISPKIVIKKLKDTLIHKLKSRQSYARKLTLMQKIPLEGDSRDFGIIVDGLDNVKIKIAKCCLPIDGDRIVGFVTKGSGITIHREMCKQVTSKTFDQERLTKVSWLAGFDGTYLSSIDLWVLDRIGLLNDLTNAVAETKVNISDLKMHPSSDKTVRIRIRVQVKNKRALEKVISLMLKIPDVLEVSRSVRM